MDVLLTIGQTVRDNTILVVFGFTLTAMGALGKLLWGSLVQSFTGALLSSSLDKALGGIRGVLREQNIFLEGVRGDVGLLRAEVAHLRVMQEQSTSRQLLTDESLENVRNHQKDADARFFDFRHSLASAVTASAIALDLDPN